MLVPSLFAPSSRINSAGSQVCSLSCQNRKSQSGNTRRHVSHASFSVMESNCRALPPSYRKRSSMSWSKNTCHSPGPETNWIFSKTWQISMYSRAWRQKTADFISLLVISEQLTETHAMRICESLVWSYEKLPDPGNMVNFVTVISTRNMCKGKFSVIVGI